MARGREPQRTRQDVIALAHRGLAVEEFFDAVAQRLRRSIGFDGACWVTIDPATLLVTSHFQRGPFEPRDVPLLASCEYADDDVIQWPDLARRTPLSASLVEATGGRLECSSRYRELLMPKGIGDELRAAFVERSTCWGAVALYRERGGASYSADDRELLNGVAGPIADGLRRAILIGGLSTERPDGPGLVLLRDDGVVEAMTPAAERWLAPLIAARQARALPSVVYAVASRTRQMTRRGEDTARGARARIQTSPGRWLVLHGSQLETSDGVRTAVIVEPAHPPEIAPLILDAYRLTEREREIVRRIIQGLSTKQIALALYLSPYTIQDHLKAIFEKVGVHSRRELLAQVFFQHYAPRVGDARNLAPDGWFAETPPTVL
jgi:DNA-binding CsgD family transcriptional regulator